MTEFQAFRVHNDNDQVSSRIENVTLDEISAGNVVIKAAYSAVNYKDALAATGKGKIIRNFPCIAGIDVAGHVVSSTDTRFREGDPVLVTGYELGTGHDGGYAEYTRVPAEWVVPLPTSLSLYEAMAIGTAGFTTALCIKRLEGNGLKPENGPFVITGATGGVGSYAVDIMSKLGYEVVAVTGKKSSREELIALGASNILDRNEIKLDGPPLEKGQWAGAIDNVGGDLLAWLTRTTNAWGSIASVGLAGGAHLNTTVMPFILRGVSVIGISSSNCPTEWRQPLWQRLASDLKPQHMDKIVSQVVKMEDLPEVFDNMLAGKTTGRTVVEINKP
jgi:NADPH2:quinone reductase